MATEWLIFDANNASNLYGNPSYTGFLGMPSLPVGITIESISFGRNHAVGLSSTGSLYGWGSNSLALGVSVFSAGPPSYPEPVLLTTPPAVTTWKAVATSDNATIALTSAGAVYVSGKLGGQNFLGWRRVSNFSLGESAISASCGLDHCIVLTTTGFYGIGANDQNQAVPVVSLGPTPTPPSSNLIITLTRIDLAELSPGVSVAPAPGVVGALPQFCTGESHTSVVWKGLAFIWGSCSSVFTGVCTASTYGIWMPTMTPISGNIFQLGCGKTHTVLRTGVSTYAIGGNAQNQISSDITAFITGWTDLFSSRGGSFGFNPFVIAGDLTLGRNNRLGTTFIPSNLLATFAGLVSDEGADTPDDSPDDDEPFFAPPVAANTNTTFSIAAFKRPSWLRLRRIDAAFGSSIRSTLAVRFREDDGACKGKRPWPTIVCAPSLLNPLKSGWISQRSLSLTSSLGLNTTLTLPGSISIVGQLWTDPALTITIPYSDMEAFPAIAVSQCAQIQSRLNVGIDPDAFDEVKKKPGRKVSFPLVQAGCRMFRNDDLSNERAQLRDDGSLESVNGEMYVVDFDGVSSSPRRDGSPEVYATLVRSPGFVYTEFTHFEEKRDSFATPDSAYTTPGVPDNSIPPSNPASAESSNGTVGLTLTKSSNGDTLKNCQKRSISSNQQTSGSTTQLVATMAVENDGCNTWWIILVSVVCGVVLLVIIALIIIFAVPPVRRRVLPYKGSRS